MHCLCCSKRYLRLKVRESGPQHLVRDIAEMGTLYFCMLGTKCIPHGCSDGSLAQPHLAAQSPSGLSTFRWRGGARPKDGWVWKTPQQLFAP
jgi:hypothetical protein